MSLKNLKEELKTERYHNSNANNWTSEQDKGNAKPKRQRITEYEAGLWGTDLFGRGFAKEKALSIRWQWAISKISA